MTTAHPERGMEHFRVRLDARAGRGGSHWPGQCRNRRAEPSAAGFRAGFALGCGAVSVDVTYALLSSFSLGSLVTRPGIRWPVGIGGSLFLLYLGVQSLRSVPRHLKADPIAQGRTGKDLTRWAYLTGVLMTLLNPMTLVFWFLELPSLGAITQDPRRDLPMICAGVFIGTLSWVLLFCGVLSGLGRWRKKSWLAAADALGGLMLLALAILNLWRLIGHPY